MVEFRRNEHEEADALAEEHLAFAVNFAKKRGGQNVEELMDWVAQDVVLACRSWVTKPHPKAPIKSFIAQSIQNRLIKIQDRRNNYLDNKLPVLVDDLIVSVERRDSAIPLGWLMDESTERVWQYLKEQETEAIPAHFVIAFDLNMPIDEVAAALKSLERIADHVVGLDSVRIKFQFGVEGFAGDARIFRFTPVDATTEARTEVALLTQGVEQLIDARDAQPADGEIDVRVDLAQVFKTFPVLKRFEGKVDRANFFLNFSA